MSPILYKKQNTIVDEIEIELSCQKFGVHNVKLQAQNGHLLHFIEIYSIS